MKGIRCCSFGGKIVLSQWRQARVRFARKELSFGEILFFEKRCDLRLFVGIGRTSAICFFARTIVRCLPVVVLLVLGRKICFLHDNPVRKHQIRRYLSNRILDTENNRFSFRAMPCMHV